MESIDFDELRQMAKDAKGDLYRLNDGDAPKIIIHWTAGHYWQPFSDYHINIMRSGELQTDCDSLAEVLEHTWELNTGTIGIAMCCCADADTEDLGEEPPTGDQIEIMAKVIATLCRELDIPCDRDYVMTHGEAGDNPELYAEEDLYGPQNGCERWDCQFLGTRESPMYTTDHEDPQTGGNVLRGKALWYIDVLGKLE